MKSFIFLPENSKVKITKNNFYVNFFKKGSLGEAADIFNIFTKKFFINNFLFNNLPLPYGTQNKNSIKVFPLILGNFTRSFFQIKNLWLAYRKEYQFIGFELWGLGLRYSRVYHLSWNSKTAFRKKVAFKPLKKPFLILQKKVLKKMVNFRKTQFCNFRFKTLLEKTNKNHLLDYKPNYFKSSFFPQKNSNNLKTLFANLGRLRRRTNINIAFKMGLSHRVGLSEAGLSMKFLGQRRLSDFRRKRFFFFSYHQNFIRRLSVKFRYLKGLNIYKFRGVKFMKEDITLRVGKKGRI